MQKTLKYGVTVLIVTMLLLNLSLDVWRNLIITPKIQYIVGSIGREKFLRKALTKGFSVPYSMMRFINDELSNDAEILSIGPFTSYYIDKPTLDGWDCIFLKNETEIEPYLLGKGAGYIFVNPRGFTSGDGDYFSVFRKTFNNSPLFSDNYSRKHLKLLFSCGGKYLFEWTPSL